jgi:uncharacterized protein YlaI
MTVKVISEKPVKLFKKMCSRCHFMLEYTPVDVQEGVKNCDYLRGSDPMWFILCPKCKGRTEVKRP